MMLFMYNSCEVANNGRSESSVLLFFPVFCYSFQVIIFFVNNANGSSGYFIRKFFSWRPSIHGSALMIGTSIVYEIGFLV